MTPRARLRLESLEVRRTPATLAADHKTVTFTDADGDTATVAFSQPVLTTQNVAGVFHFDNSFATTTNQQLQRIDLTGLAAGLSVTVKGTANGGNGTVDVGWVNATGKDVGTINISGDLGRITAGDGTTKTTGLRGLIVGSLGVRGLATQEVGGSLTSTVTGTLSALTVAGDVHFASVGVTGGTIGTVKIGGALTADPATANSGLIQATGAIGPVTIGGDVTGGGQVNSGLRAGGTLGPVTIKGNIQGGAGTDSAAIIGTLGIKGIMVGTTTVPKSVIGGSGSGSASIRTAGGNIGPVTITGSLTGAGVGSAAIRAVADLNGVGGKITSLRVVGDVSGTGANSALISADAGIGPVHIKSLSGGAGDYSGAITSVVGITSVTVDGKMTGGGGKHSGAIQSGKLPAGPGKSSGNLGPVKIGGDLGGGGGDYSGSVESYATVVGNKIVGGRIAGVTVVGDVTGGPGKYSAAIYAQDRIGRVLIGTAKGTGGLTGIGPSSATITATGFGIAAVTIYGDVSGGVGDFSAAITTTGTLGSVTVLPNQTDVGNVTGGAGKQSAAIRGQTIAKVSVAGSVTGGTGGNSASIVANRNIGTVTVTTNWAGASIAAGIDAGADGYFGTGDDTKSFAGSIGAITIKGTACGTAVNLTDHFAFTSGWVKSVKIDGSTIGLKAGKGNNTTEIPIEPPAPALPTGDFGLMELA
jgi:hypothetical protein